MTKESTNRNGTARGGPAAKIGLVLLLVIAVGAVIYAKRQPGESEAVAAGSSEQAPSAVPEGPLGTEKASASPAQTDAVPRLVDLGADKCIPCKMMAPILEELKKEYAGKLEVQFIDVWKNPDAGKQYGVRMIPTQIFFDASGKERFRHEGFMSKEGILGTWKELGVSFSEQEQGSK